MFENIDGRFDFIVFNPPQMPLPDNARNELHDWHDSPGERGYETILQTLKDAKEHLEENGELVLMVFDFLLSDGEIMKTAQGNGYFVEEIGQFTKPVRKGGQTEKAMEHILQIFPKAQFFSSGTSDSLYYLTKILGFYQKEHIETNPNK